MKFTESLATVCFKRSTKNAYARNYEYERSLLKEEKCHPRIQKIVRLKSFNFKPRLEFVEMKSTGDHSDYVKKT